MSKVYKDVWNHIWIENFTNVLFIKKIVKRMSSKRIYNVIWLIGWLVLLILKVVELNIENIKNY